MAKDKGYYKKNGSKVEYANSKETIISLTKATLQKKVVTPSDILQLVELAYCAGRDDGISNGIDNVYNTNPKCRKCDVRIRIV